MFHLPGGFSKPLCGLCYSGCSGGLHLLLVSKATLGTGGWNGVGLGCNHCLWAGEQCKGWVAEICPFLPVTDSLLACEALVAICCCINRQQSELEQLAHGSGWWPFTLLSSYSGQQTKIHLESKLFSIRKISGNFVIADFGSLEINYSISR